VADSVKAASTESPSVAFNPRLPALDGLATLSADAHTLCLAVINRSEDRDLSARIQIGNWKTASGQAWHVFELNGKDKVAANPFGSAANVNIRESSLGVGRLRFVDTFPAHSVTVLELQGSL